MYWLDTAILAVLAVAALLGARAGFVRQVARLVGLGVALYGAVRLHDRVAPWLEESVLAEAPAWVVRVASYAAVFVAIYAGLLLLALWLDRGFRAAQARWLDRVLGAAFGAFKAGVVLGIAFLALATFAPEASRDFADRSSLAPHLGEGVRRLYETIPQVYRDRFQAQLRAAVSDDDE
jgi:membrane protein required for colicin V production